MKWIKSLLNKVKDKILWKIFWIKNRNAKFSDVKLSVIMNGPDMPTGYVKDYGVKIRDFYKSNPKFNIKFSIKK